MHEDKQGTITVHEKNGKSVIKSNKGGQYKLKQKKVVPTNNDVIHMTKQNVAKVEQESKTGAKKKRSKLLWRSSRSWVLLAVLWRQVHP